MVLCGTLWYLSPCFIAGTSTHSRRARIFGVNSRFVSGTFSLVCFVISSFDLAAGLSARVCVCVCVCVVLVVLVVLAVLVVLVHLRIAVCKKVRLR